MRSIHLLTAVAAAALLAACGGDPGRGDLKEASTLVTTLSAAQLDAATAASGLQAISGKAKCDVRVVAINYLTPGVKGEMSNASGVVLLPSGTAAECTGPLPLLAYAAAPRCQRFARWPTRPMVKLRCCRRYTPRRAMRWSPPTTWATRNPSTASTPTSTRTPRPAR